MNKDTSKKKPVENEQIKKLRTEVESLLSEPEFKQMSEAFKQSLAHRLGVKEITEGGAILETTVSKSIEEKAVRPEAMARRPYYNIYRYRFW